MSKPRKRRLCQFCGEYPVTTSRLRLCERCLRKVASNLQVSEQSLADLPELAKLVDDRLRLILSMAEETVDPAAPTLFGFPIVFQEPAPIVIDGEELPGWHLGKPVVR